MRKRSIDEILEIIKDEEGLKNDKDLAEVLKVDRSTISNWKRREVVPLSIIQNYCNERGISFGWLVNDEGNYSVERVKSIVKDNGVKYRTLGDRLKIAISASNKTQKEIVEKLDINENTLSNYINNRSQPRYDQLMAISRITNVDIRWMR